MANLSIGYDGTVDENAWAKISPYMGERFRVITGLTASIKLDSARTTSITAGEAWGMGVYDYRDAVDLTSATTPSSRWDTVVLRRNRTTNTTSYQLLQGTATKAIAATAKVAQADIDAGEYDQPLWLQRVTSTSTTVTELYDLRAFPRDVVYFAGDDLPDFSMFQFGQMLVQNHSLAGYRWWRRTSTGWVGANQDTGKVSLNTVTGWTRQEAYYSVVAGWVYYYVEVIKAAGTGTITAGTQGSLNDGDLTFMNIPASGSGFPALRPARNLPMTATIIGADGASFGSWAVVSSAGNVALTSTAPNLQIVVGARITVAGSYPLPA